MGTHDAPDQYFRVAVAPRNVREAVLAVRPTVAEVVVSERPRRIVAVLAVSPADMDDVVSLRLRERTALEAVSPADADVVVMERPR